MKWTGVVVSALLLGSACAPAAVSSPSAQAAPGAGWSERTLNGLDLRRKVAQLVFPRISGDYLAEGTPQYERLRYWVRDLGVGGVIITIGPPLEQAMKLNMLQDMAAVPLMVTADMEHGAGQILRGGTVLPYGLETGSATNFPPLMAFGAAGDERLAWELGRITAIEARAAGVHVNFGPVVDVNNNPANPIINVRSFGADPALVSRMAVAYIRGVQDHGMLATVKHFPGHGDTQTDSHISLPVITVDRARADTVELPPYRAAFEAGVAAVMSAHISFPALSVDSVPATLNPALLTNLLRDELKFEGITFTDALDMGAIMNGWGVTRAPVMAMLAGADVLLQPLPNDVPVVIDAVVAAVQSGELSEARIDQSLRRLLAAKERLGLAAGARVDMEKIPAILGIPAHTRLADSVAQRAITLVRDRDAMVPLRAQRVLSVVYTDEHDPWTGRTLQRELAALLPGLRTASLNDQSSTADFAAVRAQMENADVVLISPFIRVRHNRGTMAMNETFAAWIRETAASKPVVVTSFGSPYVLQQVPELAAYLIAWGGSDAAQRAAARALTGRAPITGRLPIPIPPLHQIGEGLQRSAQPDR